VDKSYFGVKRIARNEAVVPGENGTPQRRGIVYNEIVHDCDRKALQAANKGTVEPSSLIHSDWWKGYDSMTDVGYKKHYRVRHETNEFTRGKNYMNGIEFFWLCAKES
jgi:hypothetical protein